MSKKNKSIIKTLDQLAVRAHFESSTFNEDDRTVEVVFGTDAPVLRYDWWNERYYNEVLSFEEGHLRMDRLLSGAPLLNNHDRWEGVNGVLGVVESAEINGDHGTAVIRFSKRDEVKPIIEDVKDGILRGISVGYKVHKYDREKGENGEIDTYRAVDWEPLEISLAPIPADFKSSVRSDSPMSEVPVTGEERGEETELNDPEENSTPVLNRALRQIQINNSLSL